MKNRPPQRCVQLSVLISVAALSAIQCSETSAPEPEPTLAEELQQTLDTELQRYDGIGASAAVRMPGGSTWLGTSGYSHGTTSVTTGMIFGIGSVTKTFLATVVLQLSEEGALSLDDSLHRWLPSYTNVDSTITIRQLLGHRGGVYNITEHPDHLDHIFADLNRAWTPEETISTLVLEPYFAPGTAYHYSNTGYILLGMIIEEATGSQVATEIRDRIWNPLGLSNTFLAVEETIQGETVHGWHDLDDDGTRDDLSPYPAVAPNSMHWTAGAMYSTAEDLLTFLRALLTGDLLEPSTLDEMLDFLPALPNIDYGLGVSSITNFVDGYSGMGHDGGTYGFSARMIYLPYHDIYMAVLLNYMDEPSMDGVSQALARVAIGHLD